MNLAAIGLKIKGDGKHGDGDGLSLHKSGDTGKWVFRYSHLGRRREMGLGTWPDVSLADARRERDRWQRHLRAGIDPIDERDRQRAAEIASRDETDPTFAELVLMTFNARRANLRGDGIRGRWLSPLEQHVLPKLGKRRVSTLTKEDIADALRPIWRTKHPTALKAWRRVKLALTEGKLLGLKCDPFIADAAERLLGEVRHVSVPIPATPWQEMPALYAKLREGGTVSDMCLMWAALTLVRLDGVRGARVAEIEGDVWTVPAARMKGREGFAKDFRVPLSEPCMRMVENARRFEQDLIFPSPMKKAPITDAALEKRLRTLGETGKPHGFRTAFRTWTQDQDTCSWEVAETVLAHAIGGTVERSYARSDLLERRRPVMATWAGFLECEDAKNLRSDLREFF